MKNFYDKMIKTDYKNLTMNEKGKEPLKLQTTISKKVDDLFRKHAYHLRLKNNEVLELYQNAYLKEVEREKAERKAERENRKCDKCGQLLLNQ